MRDRFKAYFHLLKPGITISNTLAAIGGFGLAAAHLHAWPLMTFLSTVGGVFGIIGSACIINNILDEAIDARMSRTRTREIVTGTIRKPVALVYGGLLGLLGFGLIALGTNLLTLTLGIVAYLSYVVIYGVAKRHTIWSTLIGTLPGALPPVAGYTALTGRLDMATLLMFILFAAWQLGHFYAIAIFRRDDYAAAKLPIWSVARGIPSTKRQLLGAVVVFTILAPVLTLRGYTHWIAGSVLTLLGLWWLLTGARGFRQVDDRRWARQMFGISLVVLLGMCACFGLGGYLP